MACLTQAIISRNKRLHEPQNLSAMEGTAMKWVYWLFLAFSIVLGIGIVFCYNGIFIQSGSDKNLFIAVGGIFLASAGWLFTSAISLRVKTREESLKYMTTISDQMSTSASLNLLWIEHDIDDIVKDENRKEAFFIENTLTSPLFAIIRKMANTYEGLAIALKEGAVEDRMMRRAFATNLRWFGLS
jgi:hypothetical protein